MCVAAGEDWGRAWRLGGCHVCTLAHKLRGWVRLSVGWLGGWMSEAVGVRGAGCEGALLAWGNLGCVGTPLVGSHVWRKCRLLLSLRSKATAGVS